METSQVTPLDALPRIITRTGEYTTRSGHRVSIHAILPGSTFQAKGTLYTPTKKDKVKASYNIWHTSGRVVAVGTHPDDVVAAT